MFLRNSFRLPLFLLGVCLLSRGRLSAIADDGVDVQTRPIVNGRRATTAELHGTVAIMTSQDGEASCTGTLIAPRVVATAAHCVVVQDEDTDAITARFAPADLLVVAGPLDASAASEAQTYALTSIIIHPGYPNNSGSSDPSGAGRYDDVALLVLERAVTGLKPAIVPTEADVAANLTAGKFITISGYGTTSADGAGGGVLFIAETVFDVRVDVEIVLGARGKPDTCPGDSGGPAYVIRGSDALLVGITSRSAEDAVATCGESGVYGFAPAYRGWFAQNSNGLYDPVATPVDPGPVDPGPVDPVPVCDPEVEDCETACDPEVEDCSEDCDPEVEDCEDDGCAASGGGPRELGFVLLGTFALLLARRRRAVASARARA